MSGIQVRGLGKSFAGRRVLADVSFDVPAGRVTGLLGPNGSGKSTTLRRIVGLVEGDGDALVDGTPVAHLASVGHRLGVLLDDRGFHPRRAGRDHLRMLAAATGTADARVDQVLHDVGLGSAGSRQVRTYSLGMRQRLGLASALLTRPDLLILDEPSNGLDPGGLVWLREMLASLAAEGVAVLVATHFLTGVHEIIDDVVVLRDGRLLAAEPVGRFVARFDSHEVVVSADDLDALTQALRCAGATVQRRRARLLVAGLSMDEVGRTAHRSGVAVTSLSGGATLENAYLQACHGPTEARPPSIIARTAHVAAAC